MTTSKNNSANTKKTTPRTSLGSAPKRKTSKNEKPGVTRIKKAPANLPKRARKKHSSSSANKLLKIIIFIALFLILAFSTRWLIKSNEGSQAHHEKGATTSLPRLEPFTPSKNTLSSSGVANNSTSSSSLANPLVAEAEHGLSALSQKIDNILAEMLERGTSKGSIKILDMEHRAFGKETYLFQRINLLLPGSSIYRPNPSYFEEELRSNLTELDQDLELAAVSPAHYIISKNSLVLYELFLQFSPSSESERPAPFQNASSSAPCIAIVIDDMGENEHALNRLLALNFPVTIAVWPRSEHARESAEKGHAKNLEIIIHQPMEPIAYPRENPGPGAILSKMTGTEIEHIIKENIALVPYAVGLNNHMGSKITQNKAVLESVLASLKNSDFFVLDSVTIEQSKFYALAKKEGFKAQKRDIFLDVKKSKKDVLHELSRAEKLAQKQGYSIAIGHPLPGTLNALDEWQKKRNTSIKIVTVQSLLDLEH